METTSGIGERRAANGELIAAMGNGTKKHVEMPDHVQAESSTSDVVTDGLRERMHEMRQDVLEQVNDRINDMVSEILHRVEMAKPAKSKEVHHSDEYCDKIKSTKGVLPSKQFLERNSVLTDLYEVQHISTIYNIFMVILILLFMNTAIHDIMDTGILNVGLDTIRRGFGKIDRVFHIWLRMKGSTLGVYIAYHAWSHERHIFLPYSLARKTWDYSWLAAFFFYQIILIVLPTQALLKEDLPIASSVIILMEQVRILMKTHAFVRSTAPRFLSYKPHTETPKPKGPSISQFLYFLFVPTLIYQDSYPRTKKIRWKVVIYSYVEVIMIIFYVAFLFERFVLPSFRQFGTEEPQWRSLIMSIFGTVLPGILFFLCGFYCLLHAWMNAAAELLRFADRMFYKDWWNSTSYGAYYRTWNVVVHDWLYTYIYKDMYEIVTPGNKVQSTFAVFFVSALFHEYILAFTFRFFYPVMLVMFGGLGFLLVFVAKKAGNVFLWLSLCIGTGIMVSMYAIEYYARVNCLVYHDGFLDFFLPRSWYCVANETR